jgi:hypothetical protein
MAYPKLPEWPIIDPENPPEGYYRVAKVMNPEDDTAPWHFFAVGRHLSMAIYFDPPLANKIDPPFIV